MTAPSRRQHVLDRLRGSAAPLTLATIAGTLGVHPNTVRFHVDHLLESGQVEQVEVERHGPGRPPAHYRATGRMDPTGPRQYRMLAEVLVSALASGPDRQVRALAAGRDWGEQLAKGSDDPAPSPADKLVNLLDQVGFAPQRRQSEHADQIALRHCPFLELAQEHTDIVCPVHLGLMQGALQEWDSEVRAERLEPFVEPDMCLAHLSATRGT